MDGQWQVTALQAHVATLKAKLAAAKREPATRPPNRPGDCRLCAAGGAGQRTMRLGMGPFEAADVVFVETLKARHKALKVQLAAAERAQDAQHAAKIAAEVEEIADKASAEFSRMADRLAAFTEARSRPWWRRLVG